MKIEKTKIHIANSNLHFLFCIFYSLRQRLANYGVKQ